MITTGRTTPLPSWALDIIAYGIQEDNDRDRRHLFRAAHRVACSALNRGWTETEFRSIVMDGIKTQGRRRSNGLWRQLNTRRCRELSWCTVDQFLSKVWQYAEANVAKGFDAERRPDIVGTARRWAEVVAKLEVALTRSENLVLDYVIAETIRRKFRNVACPIRAVAACTGLSRQGAMNALSALCKRGILHRQFRGTWVGAGNKGGKAAIYSLADPNEFFSLLGSPTLLSDNGFGQGIVYETRTGVHIIPLLGEGMSTSSPVEHRDCSHRSGMNDSPHTKQTGDETAGVGPITLGDRKSHPEGDERAAIVSKHLPDYISDIRLCGKEIKNLTTKPRHVTEALKEEQ
jgi:hypothetical protein